MHDPIITRQISPYITAQGTMSELEKTGTITRKIGPGQFVIGSREAVSRFADVAQMKRIEQLERELRVYMDAAEGHMVERMRQLDALAAEKALADRLRMAGNSLAVSSIPWSKADADYRKKRGL